MNVRDPSFIATGGTHSTVRSYQAGRDTHVIVSF